jgi:hypothetical protein
MSGGERERERPGAAGRARPASPAQAAAPRTAAARALALQRSVGNRGAARLLARWTKHPDPEKKGVMLPDASATELEHFNPPQNA